MTIEREPRPLSAAELEAPRTQKPVIPSNYVQERLRELRQQPRRTS